MLYKVHSLATVQIRPSKLFLLKKERWRKINALFFCTGDIMLKFKAVYSESQVSNPNQDPVHGIISPSATKPTVLAAELKKVYPGLKFRPPFALNREDFYLAHTKRYVDGIFDKTIKNGFRTYSDSVNASLPYTNGAMYEACIIAAPDQPACALVAGFHHAGYDGYAPNTYFCTFNGLMIAALKMKCRVAIIDCDMHFGDGTDDIIQKLRCENVYHFSFGKQHPTDAKRYLQYLESDGFIAKSLSKFKPDLIIYQSGADVHINDPMGGVLNEEQMMERDRRMFTIAKALVVPLAWCLAGGYQVDPDGGINTVIRLHMNTFKACEEVY
jgi:acetoin utilization deacetylase AcuC-like enzyme